MLIVHHLGVSQSERIVWLCEELEIPYQLQRYERDPQTRMAPAAYKALHPVGTAPIITDGDIVLPESGAIIEYILAKHGAGRLQPKPDDLNFAAYLFWFHFANGSLMAGEMLDMVLRQIPGAADAPVARALLSRGHRAYALIEERLGQVPYLAGDDFSAADIMNFFTLTTMRSFSGRGLSAMPNLRAYLTRVGARPAYRRAMAKADPDMPLRLE